MGYANTENFAPTSFANSMHVPTCMHMQTMKQVVQTGTSLRLHKRTKRRKIMEKKGVIHTRCMSRSTCQACKSAIQSQNCEPHGVRYLESNVNMQLHKLGIDQTR